MSDTFDYMLDYTEPTTAATADHWELLDAPLGWAFTWAKYRDIPTGAIVYLYSNGILNILKADVELDAGFIDRL